MYHIQYMRKITLCDLHVDVLCVTVCPHELYTLYVLKCVFSVCPMGVGLPCPLSLTNLAECNYSSMGLSGHREPAPRAAIKQ